MQKLMDIEEQASGTPQPKVELQSLNTRNYLDHTVVPILLDAMAVVAKERWPNNALFLFSTKWLLPHYSRPPDPIEYLAAYLLKHKDKYQ